MEVAAYPGAGGETHRVELVERGRSLQLNGFQTSYVLN
jgi:hypothetical protein